MNSNRIVVLSSVATAVIAALGLVYTVWIKESEPKRTIEATVSASAFAWPPAAEKAAKSLPFDQYYLQGYYRAAVRNAGSLVARQVILRIPQLQMWCLTREGQAKECHIGQGRIDVGDLSVGETASVEAWTAYPPEVVVDDINLSHADGVGRVTATAAIKPMGFFNRYPFLVLWGVIAALAFLLLSLRTPTAASATPPASAVSTVEPTTNVGPDATALVPQDHAAPAPKDPAA